MDNIDEGYIRAMMPKPRAAGHSVPVSGGRNLDRLPTLNTAETPVSKSGAIAEGPGTFDDGEARRDQGNDFNLYPQTRQEIRAFNETAISAEVSGTYEIDVNKANVFVLTVLGDTAISFAEPEDVPASQAVAGDPRDRSHGVTVVLIRAADTVVSFGGVLWKDGVAPDISGDPTIDVYVFMKVSILSSWLGFEGGRGFS